jgi:hypothetical protein
MTMVRTKTCTNCGEEKRLECFSKCSRSKDGKQYRCKSCNKAYNESNRERIKEQKRKYYLDKKGNFLKRGRDYYQHNREQRLAYQSEYNQLNRDKIRAYKRTWKLGRYAADPLFAVELRCRRRILHALNGQGFSKKATTKDMLGCTYEELMTHLESQFVEGMSWDNRSEWHIDHIVPLASAESEEEILGLCHYTNLQPLWAHENLAKGARLDWASEGVAP